MKSAESAPKPRLQKVAALFPAIFALSIGTASVGFSQEEPEPRSRSLLTRKFKKQTLRAVLAELYKGQNLEYSVDPQVPEMRLTFGFQGLTFPQARRAFMRAVRKRLPAFHAGTDTEVWVFKLREEPQVDVREID